MSKDPESFSMLKDVCSSCQICKIYKRPPPIPVVGLSMAREFNETVAMDLKEWTKDESNVWFLHLVDHATRFSQSIVIRSKSKEVIVNGIFKIWMTVFGHPQKFLVDNGGEFNNSEFHEFCESLNVKVKTTAAESPWSN